jgi:hypothetical protein
MAVSAVAPRRVSGPASEIKAEAILRVHLYSMLASIDTDKVDYTSIKLFRERWLKNITAHAPVKTRLSRWFRISFHSFQELLDSFKDSFVETDFFLSQRSVEAWMEKLEPWSFQTGVALKHWFDLDRVLVAKKVRRLSSTDITQIEDAFRTGAGRLPDATVGKSGRTLWATCRLAPADLTADGVDRLRDALGLYDRGANEFAFMVKLAADFGTLKEARVPTAFDAAGYPRFRPWPSAGSTRDSAAGRTYDLDPVEREKAGVNHGRPEMVLPPKPLASCSDFRGLGYISKDADSSVESFVAYASEICLETTRSLIERLQAV